MSSPVKIERRREAWATYYYIADLHHLPAPALPEGWEPSSMFTGCVVRYVSLLAGWSPEQIRALPFREGAIHLLVVEQDGEEWTGRPDHGVVLRGFRTQRAAIEAVERAWCNCRIKEQSNG